MLLLLFDQASHLHLLCGHLLGNFLRLSLMEAFVLADVAEHSLHTLDFWIVVGLWLLPEDAVLIVIVLKLCLDHGLELFDPLLDFFDQNSGFSLESFRLFGHLLRFIF